MSEHFDVIVIGAGISGLTCAYELRKKSGDSFNFCVLEAKERVGGRLYCAQVPTVNGIDEWDLGGQWVADTQVNVMKLIKELGSETYPQYIDGEKRMMMNNLSDVRSYSGLFPSLKIWELLDIDRVLKKMNLMCAKIPVDNPLICEFAREWDEVTLESYLAKTCTFSVTRDTVALATRTVFGVEPSQISLFYFLYYSVQAGSVDMLLETRGGAQEYRVKGTAAKLAPKLSAKIGSNNVLCGDPVTCIDQSDDTFVIVETEQGKKYKTRHVVCAIPPHLVNKIRFKPELPFNRQQLGLRMPVGNLIKFVATYKTAFWRNAGKSGESVFSADKKSVGPLCTTFDGTTSNGSPALVGFIGGEHAYYWSQRTQEERKEAVIECLEGLFGPEARTSLVCYVDKDWSLEPYNGGCPVGIMQPGCMIYFSHSLREPVGRVHWAGTETAQRWCGYIDGAVEAGQRAAHEIAAVSGTPQSKPVVCTTIFPSSSTHKAVTRSRPRFWNLSKTLIVGGIVAGLAWQVVSYYYFEQ